MVWYVVSNPETDVTKLMLIINPKATPMNVKENACESIYFGWNEYTKLRARKATKRELLDHHIRQNSNHTKCRIKKFHGAYRK